ncbi:MAG: hypothetical protein KIT59_10280 [Nitrosomonas sp.]|nr:hypothetical protein [Nitrosomonas sp.]
MHIKEFLAGIAIILTLVAFIPYFVDILRNKTKPHVFSWMIWGLTTFVVFFAQISSHGGVGAWPIGVSGSFTIIIALLAFIKRGDISITKSDWVFFIVALSALPLWYMTSDPTWSVVILTVVDILGFGPTFRKVYASPHTESISFYAMFMIRNTIVVGALESYSIATTLFPAAVAVACLTIIMLILIRRLFVEAGALKSSN